MSTCNDKEWITPNIKNLVAERQKAHLSNNYDVRDNLANKIIQEIKKAKVKYNESKAEKFTNSNSKEWYRHLTRIINNGKRSDILLTTLPELVSKTADENIDIINNHFAKIF